MKKAKEMVLNEIDELLGDITSVRDSEGKSLAHLKWMIGEMRNSKFENDKFNRWLGYIQGVMVILNLTTLNKERDRNR